MALLKMIITNMSDFLQQNKYMKATKRGMIYRILFMVAMITWLYYHESKIEALQWQVCEMMEVVHLIENPRKRRRERGN